jgi:hypothetical protein
MSMDEEEVIRDSKGRAQSCITKSYEPDPEREMRALLIILGYTEKEIQDILARESDKT